MERTRGKLLHRWTASGGHSQSSVHPRGVQKSVVLCGGCCLPPALAHEPLSTKQKGNEQPCQWHLPLMGNNLMSVPVCGIVVGRDLKHEASEAWAPPHINADSRPAACAISPSI
jgi:hypothetical protein